MYSQNQKVSILKDYVVKTTSCFSCAKNEAKLTYQYVTVGPSEMESSPMAVALCDECYTIFNKNKGGRRKLDFNHASDRTKRRKKHVLLENTKELFGLKDKSSTVNAISQLFKSPQIEEAEKTVEQLKSNITKHLKHFETFYKKNHILSRCAASLTLDLPLVECEQITGFTKSAISAQRQKVANCSSYTTPSLNHYKLDTNVLDEWVADNVMTTSGSIFHKIKK